MNYVKLFYWLTVADNLRDFFIVGIILFTISSVVSTMTYFVAHVSEKSEDKSIILPSRKWMWWSYPFCMFFWLSYLLTPSQKDSLFIIGGGQALNYLTTDSTAKQLPREFLSFINGQLRLKAAESKIELDELVNDKPTKEVVSDNLKTATADEIMNKLNTDSTYRKIVLEIIKNK